MRTLKAVSFLFFGGGKQKSSELLLLENLVLIAGSFFQLLQQLDVLHLHPFCLLSSCGLQHGVDYWPWTPGCSHPPRGLGDVPASSGAASRSAGLKVLAGLFLLLQQVALLFAWLSLKNRFWN